ncbi:IDEAL domain-containing protein [Virgibacillus xinjiangensis]|uniref:IDEAL domain-containing protein n=1 Tax=Virgibacillus xinjiangensis TaxID=393090 RepID=A0ABV7CZC1_9BACI
MNVMVDFPKARFIKSFPRHIHVMLAAADITVTIDGMEYIFIPIHANEIRINRQTKRIENTKDIYAFQRGEDVLSLTMTELISIPEFLPQLNSLVKDYYEKPGLVEQARKQENEKLIRLLEKDNILRLIDLSLDNHDERSFMELSNLLKENYSDILG